MCVLELGVVLTKKIIEYIKIPYKHTKTAAELQRILRYFIRAVRYYYLIVTPCVFPLATQMFEQKTWLITTTCQVLITRYWRRLKRHSIWIEHYDTCAVYKGQDWRPCVCQLTVDTLKAFTIHMIYMIFQNPMEYWLILFRRWPWPRIRFPGLAVHSRPVYSTLL